MHFHIGTDGHSLFLIFALVLAVIATFNVTGRLNCFAGSFACFLIALFFV